MSPSASGAILLALLLALAGCSAPTPPDDGDPTPPGGPLLEAERNPELRPYDLWNVSLGNLNGSLLIELYIDNITIGHRHPFYNVTLDVDRHAGGSLRIWAALIFDPARPAPSTRAVGGGIFAEGPRSWDTCWSGRMGEPAWILHDLLHARTGLQGGGVVTHVRVEVTDHQGDIKDLVEGQVQFPVRGGSNPYAPPGSDDPDRYCPLYEDPSSPGHRPAGG